MAAQVTTAPDPNIVLKKNTALLPRADATITVEPDFIGYYAGGSDVAYRACNSGYVYASSDGYAGCCTSTAYPDNCDIITDCVDSTMRWNGGTSVCTTACFTQSIYEYYLNWQNGDTATFLACPHETGYPEFIYRTIEAPDEEYSDTTTTTTTTLSNPAPTVTVTVTPTITNTGDSEALTQGRNSGSGGTNVGAIVGGVVGGVAGVALIAGALLYLFLKRRKNKEIAGIPEITLREQDQRVMA